jgi:hypothetical protein
MEKKEYIVTEYLIDQDYFQWIFPSVSFHSPEEVMQNINNKHLDKKTYMTKEEGSNEFLIKFVSDETIFFHILEKELI